MSSPTASTFKPRGLGRKEAAAYAMYARTIVNAHHVSQARVLSPCACLVRIIPPTVLPRHSARRPRRTLCSHDNQRTSRKLSAHAAALCSPCAHHVPPLYFPGRGVRYVRTIVNAHQVSLACIHKFLKEGLGRKEAAAYATLSRLSTRIT
jgi:hypothetical protein